MSSCQETILVCTCKWQRRGVLVHRTSMLFSLWAEALTQAILFPRLAEDHGSTEANFGGSAFHGAEYGSSRGTVRAVPCPYLPGARSCVESS